MRTRGRLQILMPMGACLILASCPPETVAVEPDSGHVAQLIAELRSDDFRTREAAEAELRRAGESAVPAVKAAVCCRDVEASRRCLEILHNWLLSDDRSLSQMANDALKELESSDDARISGAATLARRDAPENVIARLEKLGVRFTYRNDHEVTGVDLSRQSVKNHDVACLHPFQKVESIDLDYTKITSDVLETFQSFSELRELRLRCDCMRDDHLKALKPLSKLEVLNLWRTGITDAGLDSLSSLENLKELTLGHNQITDEGLKHLTPLKKLTTLNLVKTEITDRGLSELATLPKLRSLNLKGTRVTLSGIKTLHDQRPDLEIRYCRDELDPPD